MSYYKLLIADDEQRIRRGLVNSIPWSDLGFEVVADFMDGQDVLDYVELHDVDVIFTDVQMCQVSGLKVAKWVRQNKPSIKVVMLSGYKEFGYVHEAMRLEVCDYILKPLELNEIRRVFQKIKSELDEEVRKEQKNINTLLSFREDEKCRVVLNQEKDLINAVLSGNDPLFVKHCREWRMAMREVEREYVSFLIFDYVDHMYEQMEMAGIQLGHEWKREALIRRIGTTEEQFLLEEMKIVLNELFQQIKITKSAMKDDVIQKAKKYIEEHLSEGVGVEELASYVGLNRSYFSREFKAKTGENVADFILKKRMEGAIAQIKKGEYSTGKIAAAVGYADVKYFQRVFKQYTGYSVREYRNLLQ